MTKEEVKNKMRELHDNLKEHPYWRVFDHAMFRNEIEPMFREIMELVSYIKYNLKEDSPFHALHKMLWHDFSAMLSRIKYNKDIEKSDTFQKFYLPVLQNYLQIVHLYIDGIDDDDVLIMYMCDDVSDPKMLEKFVPYYHEKWITDDDYEFYFGNDKCHAVREIKEADVEKIINRFQEKIKITKIESLKEAYKQRIKDIKERTNFIYKVV